MVHKLLQRRCSFIIIVGIQPKTRHISAVARTAICVSASSVLLLLMLMVLLSFVPFRVVVHGRTGISFYEYRTSAIVYYLQLDTDMPVMHLTQPGMLLRRVVLCVAAGVGDGVLMSFVISLQLLSW